jgi:microcystin-dependent protein
MAQPYVGEIRMFAGNFAPAGWQFCDGTLLEISNFETLFNLIGTTYGGDGQSTFAVPDLRSRVPIHQGNGFTLAETGGVETVTLTISTIPSHFHPFLGTTNQGTQNQPQSQTVAQSPTTNAFPYGTTSPITTLAPASISSTGGSQPHSNIQPYLCIAFIISLFGIFPSQT